MLTENYIVLYPDDVVCVIRIIFLQVHEDLKFDARLVLEPFLIPDELYRHHLLCLVVETLQGLSEAALTQELQHLETVSNMVLNHYLIVPTFIVEAEVVRVER